MPTATYPDVAASPGVTAARDYRLVGPEGRRAIERGLAGARWYTSPVPQDVMRDLVARRDGPALRDCAIYFGLMAVAAWGTVALWGRWWAAIPMMFYGVLYASASDSRWHEAGHGTAFKTDWMNDVLYEVASFMVLRESVPWLWSHARHHSDTIIVGRDPEIAVPRPPDVVAIALKLVNARAFRRYFTNVFLHCVGRVTEEEATFMPREEYARVFVRARAYAAILLAVVAGGWHFGTWLPFVFVFGPNLYGAWLMPVYAWTQHAGLAEDVLDHRLNCRTVLMGPINRFLYWNMNYHLEHHMFPMVPYHQLPRLHEIIKRDCPPPYPGLVAAYREIVPTIWRQLHDPGYFVRRELPAGARRGRVTPSMAPRTTASPVSPDGWIDVCGDNELQPEEVLRFDHAQHTYAVCRTADGTYHATDGICTHGNAHLADGALAGTIIQCPKHNGRFDVTTGEPCRLPARVALRTHELTVVEGRVRLRPAAALADTSTAPAR